MKQLLFIFLAFLILQQLKAEMNICEKIEDKEKISLKLHALCNVSSDLEMRKDCLKYEYDGQIVWIDKKPLILNVLDLSIQQSWHDSHKLAVELSEKSRCLFEKSMEKRPHQKMALLLKNEIIFNGTFSANFENEILILPMPRSWSIEEIQSICHFKDIHCIPKRFIMSDHHYTKLLAASKNLNPKITVDYSRVWLHFSSKITNLDGLELKLAPGERNIIFGFQENEKGAIKSTLELAGLGKFKREEFIALNLLSSIEELKADIDLAFVLKNCQNKVETYYQNVNLLIPQIFYSRNFTKDLRLFTLNSTHAFCAKTDKKVCSEYIKQASLKNTLDNCQESIVDYLKNYLKSDVDGKELINQCLIEKKANTCHNLGYILSSHYMRQEALLYYAQACNLNYVPSCINGGLVAEELSQYSQAELLYGKACHEDNPTSCFAQSKLFLKMGNVEKSKQKALKGCELKQAASCSLYGTFLEQEKNEAGAIDFYIKSCMANDPHGCLNLGRLHLRHEKRQLAKESFEKSCQYKLTEGCLALASYYFLQEDFTTALKKFKKLCNDSQKDACYYAGKIYAHQNKPTEAIASIEKAFKLGKKVDNQVLFEDSYFKNLRKNKTFQDLVERYQKNSKN